jgi:hypothetical protein
MNRHPAFYVGIAAVAMVVALGVAMLLSGCAHAAPAPVAAASRTAPTLEPDAIEHHVFNASELPGCPVDGPTIKVLERQPAPNRQSSTNVFQVTYILNGEPAQVLCFVPNGDPRTKHAPANSSIPAQQ